MAVVLGADDETDLLSVKPQAAAPAVWILPDVCIILPLSTTPEPQQLKSKPQVCPPARLSTAPPPLLPTLLTP